MELILTDTVRSGTGTSEQWPPGLLACIQIAVLDRKLNEPIAMKDQLLRGIFLSFVRVHVLHHAVEGEVYGVEMIEELARHGYSLGPGTVYPLLHSMEKSGYLLCEKRVVDGKVRKYYRATEDGRLVLTELRAKIQELIHEVL